MKKALVLKKVSKVSKPLKKKLKARRRYRRREIPASLAAVSLFTSKGKILVRLVTPQGKMAMDALSLNEALLFMKNNVSPLI